MSVPFNLVKRSWEDEIIATTVYSFISNRLKRKDEKLSAQFEVLSKMEKRHAELWNEFSERLYNRKLKEGLLLKIKKTLLKLAVVLLPLAIIVNYLELGEKSAAEEYSKILKYLEKSPEDKAIVEEILREEIEHEHVLLQIIIFEKTNISNVKDAIYGMTDSLVEILALVIGLASIIADPLTIGLAGLIAGIGGTFSMTAGAYLSAKSQNDVYYGAVRDLEIKYLLDKNYVKRDLKSALVEKGLADRDAEELSSLIENNPKALFELTKTVAIEETPTDPKATAYVTGIYYILGALPAVVPFFVGAFLGTPSIQIAIFAVVLSAIVSFVGGVISSILSGISAGREALQNMVITIGAALATYTIGTIARMLLGISV